MNDASDPRTDFKVREIFPESLLEYAQSLVFPWPQDKPLNGAAVGQGLFKHATPSSEWDVPEVRAAMKKLAEIGPENIRLQLDKFPEFVRDAGEDDIEMSAPDRNLGMILILDQGARCVCTGVNARYAYDFFHLIPLHTIKYITTRGMAKLEDWEAAGFDKDQAIIRAIVMLGALVDSEDPTDHEHHLRLTETLRREYERLTRTRDPYRASLSQDLQDIDLFRRMHDEGPPQGEHTHMTDVIYWMMRFYASGIAFMRYFNRSPFNNVAMGREDTDEELDWLKKLGVARKQEDEKAREMIKDDIKNGRWRPLEL